MDEISTEYFSSTNHLFKAFIGDIEKVENSNRESWSGMSFKHKSRLIDEFYKITKKNTGHDSNTEDNSEDDDEYYNVLKIESGEKVVVDFENNANGWTWVDEHSSPFSWKSKSQQDLRFKDLFGENTTNKNNNIKNKDNTKIYQINKESISFSKSNQTETGAISNIESNEIEMMFKKFGLNVSDQKEGGLVSGMAHSSETNHNLLNPSNQTNSSASETIVSISGALKPTFLDQNAHNEDVFLDANTMNLNTKIKKDKENSSTCKLKGNKEYSNCDKLTSDFNLFKEDDNKFKLNLRLGNTSKEDRLNIDFGACVGESSIDNGNLMDKEVNSDISKKENDLTNTIYKNSSYQEVSEDDGVINLQPKSEILTVKKTGFDFLDNW